MRLCEVSRRRFRCQDVVRILILPRYFPQICSCKESAWGRGPMSGEVGGKGGIRTVNPDHPRRKPPQVADEEGWKHKRRLSRGEISLLLAPPPSTNPHLWPATTPYLLHKAQTLRRRQVLRGNLKLAELQNSVISPLQRLPLHWWEPTEDIGSNPKQCCKLNPRAYQIIVADAADAVSVNFSGRCKFFQT